MSNASSSSTASSSASSATRRVGAVDCGTNSIRLLIADVAHLDDSAPALTDVVRTMTIVRLGQGVDATGQLAPEALERTFAACENYARQCREHDVETLRFVATSATRDASNRDEFTTGVERILGVTPEVVEGSEEAALSFAGALSSLPTDQQLPTLVVDLGGGSTEFVLGDRDGVSAALSTDIGCVRLTERHLHDDPPTQAQIEAALADIDAAIDDAASVVPFDKAGSVVGVAGTVTTITAHALGLPTYDSAAIDGTVLPIETVRRSADELLRANRETRAAFGFMHPGRVDVIGSGALIWSRILERVQQAAGLSDAVTSEHDILDGIALSQV